MPLYTHHLQFSIFHFPFVFIKLPSCLILFDNATQYIIFRLKSVHIVNASQQTTPFVVLRRFKTIKNFFWHLSLIKIVKFMTSSWLPNSFGTKCQLVSQSNFKLLKLHFKTFKPFKTLLRLFHNYESYTILLYNPNPYCTVTQDLGNIYQLSLIDSCRKDDRRKINVLNRNLLIKTLFQLHWYSYWTMAMAARKAKHSLHINPNYFR